MTYNVNNKEFLESSIYRDFILDNRGFGNLKVRAYTASEAMPISGVSIIVSTIYNGDKIIFFEGLTNESGIIEKIKLPAPISNSDDEVRPNKRLYEIDASYKDFSDVYEVNIYDNVCTLQSISIGEM